MAPVDTASTAKPINFSVVLPASWSHRAAQLGGGGINGIVPNLTGGGPGARAGAASRAASPPTAAIRDTRRRSVAAVARAGRGPRRAEPATDDWALNDEAIANLGYAQMKKTHDAAMVIIERVYGARPRFNYYIGNSQGGREGADRRAALSGRLRRRRRERADRQLLDADAGARADSHPREAAGQLGDAGQGQRDPRRVHAAVRLARRPRRRDHQQLHGVPRHLRRLAGRAEPAAMGGEALSEQRRSESRGHERQRVSDRRPDFDTGVHVLALPVCDAARPRHAVVRHVGPQHRSVRQRADPQHPVQGTGGGDGRRADALASRRARRHRVPDEEPVGQPAGLRGRRARSTGAARNCRRSSIRPTPTSRRFRSEAAR